MAVGEHSRTGAAGSTRRLVVGAAVIALVVLTAVAGTAFLRAQDPVASGTLISAAVAGPKEPEVPDSPFLAPAESPTTSLLPPPPDPLTWAGRPVREGTPVYDGIPPLGRVIQHLPLTGPFGEDTVVRVYREALDTRGDRWYYAYLPQKPNESKGWIRGDDLSIFARDHRIVIDLSDHRLDLLQGEEVVGSFPVAVGQQGTPTPTGEFFVTVRVKPPNPGGAYGPLALGLSAYSEVLTDWPGGGQAAIHGTNNPSAIGTDASHGCVRMRNEDILRVGDVAFVGTPVRIVP